MAGSAFGPAFGPAFNYLTPWYDGTTGPDYPPDPASGSNGLGLFTIGTGQIGDIPPFNFWQTVISQYANSPILTQLIASFDAAVDQTLNFELLYDNIWNVNSAQGYGLDVWGRIVGISRIVEVPSSSTYFGFAESTSGQPFGQAPFYNYEPTTSSYALSDTAFRQLILAKALANISSCSIPAINRVLLTLFPGRGNCYVTDIPSITPYFGFAEQGNAQPFNQAPFYDGEALPSMQMTYTFDFSLTPVELTIVQNGNVLPKPVGVTASVVINL